MATVFGMFLGIIFGVLIFVGIGKLMQPPKNTKLTEEEKKQREASRKRFLLDD